MNLKINLFLFVQGRFDSFSNKSFFKHKKYIVGTLIFVITLKQMRSFSRNRFAIRQKSLKTFDHDCGHLNVKNV